MKRWILALITLLAVIGLTTPTAYTQTAASRLVVEAIAQDETPHVMDVNYPDMVVYVTPVNETGVPLGGLNESHFTLREDGVPVDRFTVEHLVNPDQRISVMLLLDISGSMRNDMAALKESALEFFQHLELGDQVAVIAFNELADGTAVDLGDPFPRIHPDREMDFTTDGGALINLINALETEQYAGTPLYDALFKGIRMTAMSTTFGRRAVIVMTDGVDESRQGRTPGSRIADPATVIAEAQRHKIPVFTIGLGYQIDDAFLQRVASLTGGAYQKTPEAEELGALFTDVATNLKQQYRITYRSQIVSDNELHNLTIGVQSSSGAVEETVAFRARFPVVPWIRTVNTVLPRQDARPLRSLDGVKGSVTIRPEIAARAAIAEVNYYVDEQLVYTVHQSPWEFRWNTRELEPDRSYQLRIEAVDDLAVANVGIYESAVPVLECSIICVLDQLLPINPLYLGMGMGLPLLLLALLLVRRRQAVEMAPVYNPARATSPGMPAFPPAPEPSFFTPAPQPEPKSTVRMDLPAGPGGVAGFGIPGAAARPSPKTEVLRREPQKVAFFIDVNSGREFRLQAETSIGREAGNDIILDEASVSGRHAKVRLEEDTFFLYDLAATNPVTVNDQQITRQALKNGDSVRFGRHRLVFKQVD
jgi:VWFA-related protein